MPKLRHLATARFRQGALPTGCSTASSATRILSKHIESVNLSGGEPFVHPNISELISDILLNYARLREVCINTDGHRLFDIQTTMARTLPRFATAARSCGCTSRSTVSGSTTTGTAGITTHSPQADQALRYLAQAIQEWPDTLRTTASFTITDRNVDQIVPVFEYVRELGLRVDYNLAARPEVFIGGGGLERRFQVLPEQVPQVREAIRKVCEHPENTNFSSAFYATMLQTLESGRRSRGCFFPDKGFVLMPDGKVYICGTYLDFYFGDFLVDDFETLWNGAQRSRCRTELIPAKCESCFSNSYEDWDLLVGAKV